MTDKQQKYTTLNSCLTISSGDSDDDTDVIEVESNFLGVEELQDLLERHIKAANTLEHFKTHIDAFEPEQRGEMARILAETEYFRKEATLKDLIKIVERLEQTVEHYRQ